MMKKMIVFCLLVVSMFLIIGCTSGNDGFTDEEREILQEGDAALSGQATNLGCRVYSPTIYTCSDMAGGVALTYTVSGRTRTATMLDGCKLGGRVVYDYSCPSDRRGFQACRTSCTEGCEEGITMCDEDIERGCSDTDGGVNYNIQGTLLFEGIERTDQCLTNTDINDPTHLTSTNECNGDNCFIEDYECTGDSFTRHNNYTCPYGCVNGACQPPCEPEGGYQLSADGMSVKTCSSGRWVDATCTGLCGNGVSDPDETCTNCGADVHCEELVCGNAVEKNGRFLLGGVEFQYLSADDIAEESPLVKIKNVASGETYERSVSINSLPEGGSETTFNLRYEGVEYNFKSSSDPSLDDYQIELIC